MKYNEIINGINLADTKEQLKSHIDKVSQALDLNLCDYHSDEWRAISETFAGRLEAIKSRPLH